MAFLMYCDCGPNGTRREVLAARVDYLPPVRTHGDRKRKAETMNRCYSCGKLWPPPGVTARPRARELQDAHHNPSE